MKVSYVFETPRPTKLDICLAYAGNYVKEQLSKLHPDKLMRIEGFYLKPLQLAQQIAMQLYLQKKQIISSNSDLFDTLGYHPELPF
jgi:hypothetical protein